MLSPGPWRHGADGGLGGWPVPGGCTCWENAPRRYERGAPREQADREWCAGQGPVLFCEEAEDLVTRWLVPGSSPAGGLKVSESRD